MNILDKIIEHKKKEITERKKVTTISDMEVTAFFHRSALSLKESLLDKTKTGIIAEFKRRSPSKGVINDKADVQLVTKAYAEHDASGLSVLTDETFFGGNAEDLKKARRNQIPILRKDFVIDEYQVAEAKAMGADVILLIAACLEPKEVRQLASFAKQLGLETLLELHDEAELEHICDETELIGINNRNLKTFEVDLERSLRMAEKLPGNKIKIAESGIDSIENIRLFRNNGFHGFLIGENFMKAADPAIAFARFAEHLKSENE